MYVIKAIISSLTAFLSVLVATTGIVDNHLTTHSWLAAALAGVAGFGTVYLAPSNRPSPHSNVTTVDTTQSTNRLG